MTELVPIDPPPPQGVPLRVDRPLYQYGPYYVGMTASLSARMPNYIWLAYDANGRRIAYAATRERLVLALESL